MQIFRIVLNVYTVYGTINYFQVNQYCKFFINCYQTCLLYNTFSINNDTEGHLFKYFPVIYLAVSWQPEQPACGAGSSCGTPQLPQVSCHTSCHSRSVGKKMVKRLQKVAHVNN